MRTSPIIALAFAVTALVASADDATTSIEMKLAKGDELTATIDLTLASSMRGPESAPLRLLSDEAWIAARFRFRVVDVARSGVRSLAGEPLSVSIRRRFQLRASGLIGEDRRDEVGQVSWKTGDAGPAPLAWPIAIDAQGRVFPNVETAEQALALERDPSAREKLAAELALDARESRWRPEAWLKPLDDREPEDAKLHRAGRWFELGPGFLGAPTIAAARGDVAATTSFEAGESGLTNALVDVAATFAMKPTDAGATGALASLDVLGGSGLERDRRRPDRWLELARREGGLGAARGELEARFDRALGIFADVKSEVSLEVKSNYGEKGDTFPGTARFERKLHVAIAR